MRHKGVGNNINYDRRPHAVRQNYDPLTFMRCFNCDQPEHMISTGPVRMDLNKAAMRKIEYMAKKSGKTRNVHVVLFELCQQLDEFKASADDSVSSIDPDEASDVNEAVENEDLDINLLEALMNYVDGPPTEIEACINITSHTFRVCNSEVKWSLLGRWSPTFCCGKSHAEAYYRYMVILLAFILSRPKIYKFGSHRNSSIWKAKFRIPCWKYRHMKIEFDVIGIDIPLLLDLDVLDKYKFMVDTVDNRLRCKEPKWSTALTRKLGHVY